VRRFNDARAIRLLPLPFPMPSDPYRSVACGFYDRLEALALRGQPVELVWTDADGEQHRAMTRVADLFSDDRGEWLRLDDARAVRLDRIVSVYA